MKFKQFLLRENFTFQIPRVKLNVPYLIQKGAIFVTHPHEEPIAQKDKNNNIIKILKPEFDNPAGKQQAQFQNQTGWIVFPNESTLLEDNKGLFSLISLQNTLEDNWAKDAPRYKKTACYQLAEQMINMSKPNLGNYDLVYDEKYQQILWSIKYLELPENMAYQSK
jgi:hypothetical protein